MTASVADPDTLRDDLTRLFRHGDFRAGQREIIENAVAGRDTLAVMPTGGGKSLTYQLPAMLVPGATLVLSPLIALMKDQAENLPPEVAARSTVINSSLDGSEVGKRLSQVKSGRIKMIYAAPERLRQPPFLHALRRAEVSLVVVDEAHCISQWGHDFRPDYRAVGKAVAALNPRSVLAVTATATPEVQDDIERQLGRRVERIVRPTYRDNLFLACRRVQGEDEKLWTTLEMCREAEGVGLVYAGSRDKVEKLAMMLKRHGIKAGFYHAGLPPDERARAQDDFMSGRVRVMAATVAFGMGVDKADIRFLIHYNPSRSLENYYQEAGRAGRDGEQSHCTLLHSTADASGASRHLREDMLTMEHIRAVYNGVRATLGRRRVGPVKFEELSQACGGDDNLVRAALPLLEEAELISRTVDIPRRLAIYPDHNGGAVAEEGAPYGDEGEDAETWQNLLSIVGGGGDFDPADLAAQTGIALPDLEETILRQQDKGRLTYRTLGGRDFLIEMLPAPSDTKDRMAQTLHHRATGQKERGEAMLAYARDNRCRHGQIARYFGDRWPNLKCGMCDVCAGGTTTRDRSGKSFAGSSVAGAANAANTVDPREAPIAALRIVHDLANGYRAWAVGKPGLVKSLRGTPDAPITADRTKAFGVLASLKRAEVERLVDALVESGYLVRDEEDEYRRLHLTAEGKNAVASGEADVEWRMGGQPRPFAERGGKAVSGDVDTGLLASLKTWRRELADEMNVPPYVVFSDRVLEAIAAQKPVSEHDLLDISGIGPAKAARFGEAVLRLVQKHSDG